MGWWEVIGGAKKAFRFAEVLSTWAADLSISEPDLYQRAKNAFLLIQAYNKVPWPHPFFSTFLRGPAVKVPPFYGKSQFQQPKILLEKIPQDPKRIETDIATYLDKNQVAFAENFDIVFERWVMDEQKKFEKKVKLAEKFKIFAMVIGTLASLITGGLLAPIAIGMARMVFERALVKRLTSEQKKTMGQIMEVLGTTQGALNKMNSWVEAKAEKPPPPKEVPKPPVKEIAPVDVEPPEKKFPTGIIIIAGGLVAGIVIAGIVYKVTR
jgi:hypothetical protein